jgi:hypothetical protein
MLYTSFQKLEKKLKGRLKVFETPEIQLYPDTSLQQEVDPDLVIEIVEEQENFVNLILSQIYLLPLQNQHPILSDIVTDLAIAELLQVHYLGPGFGNVNSSDISGATNNSKQDAYLKLYMLTAGMNIYIPGVNLQPYIPSFPPPRRLILPNEILISSPATSTPVRNQTIIIKAKEVFPTSSNLDFDSSTNPFA